MKSILKVGITIILSLLCGYAPPIFAHGNMSEDSLVKQFFPPNWETTGSYAYADADLDGGGKDNYIVASYTNGVTGAVRVLEKTGPSSAVLLAAPSFPLMGGVDTDVTMRDVNGDGIPEAIVSFDSANGRNESVWILKWNGVTLKSIGPGSTDSSGEVSTDLYSSVFMDLTGNGKLDVISSPESVGDGEFANGGAYTVYSLVNGQYEKSGTLNAIYYYRRSKGTPTVQVRQFSASNTESQSVMTIVNGTGTSKLASSAVIKLNGVTVVNQSQFNQQTKLIKVPVTLQPSNTLSVTLDGAPGSLLTVAVGSAIKPQ